MKMNRREFEITLPDCVSKTTVSGLTTDTFGIHTCRGEYAITHLRTGGRIRATDKMKTARASAGRLHQMEIPWDTDSVEVIQGYLQDIQAAWREVTS